MANHGQVHSIKTTFDPFRLWFPHSLPLRDLFCGPTTIPTVPSSTVFTHFSPQSTLTTCYPSYAAPFFILPISNPSWVTPADFVTHAPSVICNTSPTTNTHCCFYKGHQPTIFIKGNSLLLFNLSAPSDSNDCLSLRLSSVISGSWDFLLCFQFLLFLVIFVFSPLQERHWVFLFVFYLGHFIFFPPPPLPKRYGPVTAQSSVFHYSYGIPLNTTFTNCLKSQTGYPTCTSKLVCPRLTITLTLISVRSDFPISGITKYPGRPR